MSDRLQKALSAPMDDVNDAGATDVADYLRRLLRRIWEEGEAFSGKRPFGNSGWQWDVYEALVKVDLIRGHFDEDGYLDDVDEIAADLLVMDLIDHALTPHPRPSKDRHEGGGERGE